MSAQVLSFFWELAALNVKRRVKAAAALVDALTAAQTQFGGSAAGELCPDLAYAVRRLVRGLASPRDGARQGFGAALIEVLRAFDEVTPEEVLQQMESTLQLTGAIKGSEERDVLFGRLFACGALVRSGRVPRLPSKRRATVVSKLSSYLLSCLSAKAFLQEPASYIICEFLRSLSAADIQSSAWPALEPLLKAPMAEWTPHALLLALSLTRGLPADVCAQLLPQCEVRDGSIVHAASLSKLLPPLKASSASHPRQHIVWNELLDMLCPYDGSLVEVVQAANVDNVGGAKADGNTTAGQNGKSTSKQGKAKRKAAVEAAAVTEEVAADDTASSRSPERRPTRANPLFRRFWQEIVDEGLIPSTLERKYLAFSLVQACLPRLGGADLPLVLSPALVRCLVNALEGPDRMLRPVASATVAKLVERARAAPPLRVALVSQLLTRASRGAGQDRADASRALRQLIAQGLDPSGEEEYTTFLLDYFVSKANPELSDTSADNGESAFVLEQERAHALEGNRRWAIEQLYTLAKGSISPPKATHDMQVDSQGGPSRKEKKAQTAAGDASNLEAAQGHASAGRAPPTPPLRVLRFLFSCAFFSASPDSAKVKSKLEAVGGVPEPIPSDALRTLCASRFFSLLGEAIGAINTASHSEVGSGAEIELLEVCQAWWSELAPHGVILQPAPSTGTSKVQAWQSESEASSLVRNEALKLIAQLRSRRTAVKGSDAGVVHKQFLAIEILAHHLSLQLLSQPAAAASAISELPACVVQLRQRLGELPAGSTSGDANGGRAKSASNGKLTREKGKTSLDVGGEPEDGSESEENPPSVVEVVVDILLSMLVQPSAMLREMARSVIRPFNEELTESAIELMVNVLRSPLGKDDEEDDDDDDDEDDEEESDEDEEDLADNIPVTDMAACAPCDGSDDAGEDEDEDDDDDEDEQALIALETAAGLRPAPAASAADDGDSEAEMPEDPEDIARLDAKLAAMVRERIEAQSAAKERREQQLHFKMRVLELIETLARRPAPSAVLLLLPLPLLRILSDAAAQPTLRPMFERVAGMLRHRLCKVSIRSPWPVETVPPARLMQDLEGCFALAARARGGGPVLATAITDAIMLLIRTMTQHKLIDGELMLASSAFEPEEAAKASVAGEGREGSLNTHVLELLHKHLGDFYNTKNCRLNGRLIVALLERFPLLGWSIAPLMVSSVAHARDAFLCTEACSHLCTLLSQRAAIGEACARLVPHVAAIQTSLQNLLSREGLRSKHLLAPIRLATTLVRTLKDTQQKLARQAHAELSSAIEAVREKHGNAKALVGCCAKYTALASGLGPVQSKKSKQRPEATGNEGKTKRTDSRKRSKIN